MKNTRAPFDLLGLTGIVLLLLAALPFAIHAISRGADLLAPDEQAVSRLFRPEALSASFGIYTHMIAGGIIMLAAPVQLWPVTRHRWPRLHHFTGYTIAAFASVTAVGGLYYIATVGTIGGAVMNVGFALYGALMLLSVIMTVHLAQRRDPRHRLWAERLVILAMASWLYRVHYGVWEIVTGGAGSQPDFRGLFDRIQVFAFYLPYLILHAWFWQGRTAAREQLR
ncbi:MAG: DUF2306 domain-containing protein [Roseobacter sp.]|jgi:hypothetical protein|nr:DUF2306 domain-containing protein [Roseobacter sp.]